MTSRTSSASLVCSMLISNHSMLPVQVKSGVDALTIKRKYKELAVALHPDKCKVSLTQS